MRIAADVAIRVLEHLALGPGETVLVHGAANEVGSITTQLAIAGGANVIASVSSDQFELMEQLGARPITLGGGLAERVHVVAPRGIDAAFDAVYHGLLLPSLGLVENVHRVVTLSDESAQAFGCHHVSTDWSTHVPIAPHAGLAFQ